MAIYPDISHHHAVSDWKKLQKKCGFIISKATEGRTFIDPSLDEFIKNCEKYDIPYWVYAYLRKDYELEQTKFMVETCKKKVGKNFVGYILDVEENSEAKDVITALRWLEKQGTKCMFYCMWAQYEKYKDVVKTMGKNTVFWEARYGKNNGIYSSMFPCHAVADLHQYTSQGKCDGIKDKIDLNRLTGRKKEEWFTTPLNNSDSSEKVSKAFEIPKLKGYKGFSIVDGLKKYGYKSDFKYRGEIWKALGKTAKYKGTAKQNLTMLTLLKRRG